MGRLDESGSSLKMAKKKSSDTKATKTRVGSSSAVMNLNDPKTQVVLLIGLLTVLAVALWYGFTHGCLRRRRRRSC